MKKPSVFSWIFAGITALLAAGLLLFLFCPALNLHNPGLWLLITVVVTIFAATLQALEAPVLAPTNRGGKGRQKVHQTFRYTPPLSPQRLKYYLIPAGLLVLVGVLALAGSPLFHATRYASIRTVTESDFAADLAESVGTDSIALMDTASAQMLGDREIGSLSDVVSQYDVSYEYSQIDLGGKPIKVSALGYAGFWKWINNSDKGAGGYVTVDPVSMSASFHRCEGMKYIPSAYFFQDAERYLWMQYPTLMLGNLHFEIDEDGKPYYIASVYEKTIFLFGGKTVSGCVVLDPVTGETVRYAVDEVPRWIDIVFDGNLICQQYNWYGSYQNGFANSLFGKKDCKQVTTYTISENADEDAEDDAPISDYGYVAKDGDIWIYTGITSVNGDSSNIGFLLANERTGESRYYVIAGADEKSAMAAAEGEVQEKRYQASFPSLINIDGCPTYIMVLKDSGGLVKLYATVNVEQYNLVTTAPTQAECIAKYKALLGIEPPDSPAEPETTTHTVTLKAVRYITVDGNTYLYLIDTEERLYKAKAADHEALLVLEAGDRVELVCSGTTIVSGKKLAE